MRTCTGSLLLCAALIGCAAVGFPREAPSMRGELDPQEALEILYGKLETEGDAALWKPSEDVREAAGMPNWHTIQVSVLGALAFRQTGAERKFLITKLVPVTERAYDCHSCAPGIGAATFTKTADGWRLDARNPNVTELGAWGNAPEPKIAKMGPDQHGVVFQTVGVGQGYYYRFATFLLEAGQTVNQVLHVETGSDNSGACDPECEDLEPGYWECEGLKPCYSSDSELEFVPGEHAEYFDLKMTTTSTPSGETRVTVFAYNDGTYQERSP
jgi:hypothetical protein